MRARDVEAALDRLLPEAAVQEQKLWRAMRYACLDGGKRLRPFLVVEAASLFGVRRQQALRAAAAMEMVHCCSLVFDDLPALDDDKLRRGRPACHVVFGEATAILTAASLLMLAFEVLADPATHPDAEVRIGLIDALAKAAGPRNMAAGQAIDLAFEHKPVDVRMIERMQGLKTGALFASCAEIGAILGKADANARESLVAFGRAIGCAFQIADDLLDREGDRKTMGKETGKDAAAGKATLVQALGCDQARREAERMIGKALVSLEGFGGSAHRLRDLAQFVISRNT